MTIQEILEAHDYRIVEEQFKGHGKVKTIACNCGDRYGFFETHRAHVAEVLDKHMREHTRMWQEHAYEVGYVQACEDIENGADGPTIPNPYRKETRNGRE